MNKKTLLDVEIEFGLMVGYQVVIESKCVIVKNSPKNKYKYSLYSIVEPIPSYIAYINGDDFIEGKLIKESSLENLKALQESRRVICVV